MTESGHQDDLRRERYRLASALIVAEYQSLRTESLSSMERAQHAVQWSLSAFGVLFAAALIASNNAIQLADKDQGMPLQFVVLMILGAGLPGLICMGAWTWLAELSRMERAGAMLRSLEQRVSRIASVNALLEDQPIKFERFIAESKKQPGLVGKQVSWYLGVAGLFCGSVMVSAFAFIYFYLDMADGNLLFGGWFVAVSVVSVLIWIAFFLVSLISGKNLLAASSEVPDMRIKSDEFIVTTDEIKVESGEVRPLPVNEQRTEQGWVGRLRMKTKNARSKSQ